MADRKRTGPDWQDMRVFLAVARHGSLSAAARALRVNHATVARRLRSLEADLAEKLVERRPEGYVLTAAGGHALEAAAEMERAADALKRGIADGAPTGLVRVNAPPGLAAGFLTARLAEVASRHEALDIDLATNLRPVSLERHETDIAIRIDRPEDGDVIARPLVGIGYGYYGTPEAILRWDEKAPVFVGFDEADTHIPEAVWLNRHFPRARLAFRAGDHQAQAVAARSGVGVVLLPHFIGRTEPGLQPCAIGAAPPPRHAYLLTRRRDRHSAAIRLVAEAVLDMFATARPVFE